MADVGPDVRRPEPGAVGIAGRPLPGGVAPAPPAEPRSRRTRPAWLGPCVTSAALATVVGVSGVRGADYPAQMFRALLWARSGPALWNAGWYGGHATPTYSVLTPPLAALLGVFLLTAVSSIGATYAFARLTAAWRSPASTALAAHAFAVAATVNVVVGRTAFALGTALGLAALWQWSRGRTVVAVGAAVLTALASPVAAVFLALAAAGVALRGFRPAPVRVAVGPTVRAVAIAAAALAPVALAALVFPEPSRFPFEVGGLVASILALAAVGAVVREPAVRVAAALSVLAAVAVFVVPNPLGGSFARLTQLGAVPLALTAVGGGRRWSRVLGGVGLGVGMLWSVLPATGAVVGWAGDPSVGPEYHRPLVEEVRARNLDGRPLGRLEIPFTANHWESYHVAAEVPYARGWERQLDLVRNAELYDPDLSVVAYRRWLLENAVRWVAIPDVALDAGGGPEAALVAREGTERDIPWLRLVWRDDHWRLYEVAGYFPLVDLPAHIVRQDLDHVVLRTDGPATVTVRYRYVPTLAISPSGCLEASTDGWVTARLPGAGVYTLRAAPFGRHGCA